MADYQIAGAIDALARAHKAIADALAKKNDIEYKRQRREWYEKYGNFTYFDS